ncbi:MAG: glycogen synthase GlgA [Planctomycetales bacterium]|nr:glycogen synthase GlgA [Planctomycetales bacterium]
MVPFAKTGGLGDVCGALPIALERLGHRSIAFLPAYRSVLRSGIAIEPANCTFTIDMAGRHMACRVLKTHLPNSQVEVYLIDQPHYYDRDGVYSDFRGEFRDNCERFSFFSRAVAEAIDQLQLDVDIVHCHDWTTGLIPAYMKTGFRGYSWFSKARSIMTIHNLAYQGRFWHFDMPLTGLDWTYFNWRQMEYYGDLNLLKTGIVFADAVTTVSPTYAHEITTPQHGCGLDGILESRGGDLVGIVNGVDYAQWNPASDPYLVANYSIDDWQTEKLKCKQDLQRLLELAEDPSAPLVGVVSRLADQKGWDLIIPMLLDWVHGRHVQFAILGTGDPRYETELRQLAEYHRDRLAVRLEFSESLAHKIEAGSDMFLMPSRYEPCGLNQLYSLRYGSVPIVHRTGGLADTVIDANDQTYSDHTATGFCFSRYSLQDMTECMVRAVDTFERDSSRWQQIVANGMSAVWSWEQSAERYVEIYNRLLARPDG